LCLCAYYFCHSYLLLILPYVVLQWCLFYVLYTRSI